MGCRDLFRDRQRLVKPDRRRCDSLGWVLAFDEFDHQPKDPLDSSRPWMCAMFGWFSDARTFASTRLSVTNSSVGAMRRGNDGKYGLPGNRILVFY
jgi:hypothetical protein